MAAAGFEDFCGGEFWNETLLLRNTWPEFTDCFIHTVIIWIPCGFLLLALPYYVTSVGGLSSHTRTKATPLFEARLYCCLMLACLALVRLFVRAVGDALSRSPAAFLGDGLYITAYVLLAVMTRNERLKCIHTSPVTFFFWLLTSVCNVIPFYTYVIERLYNKDIVSFLVFMMSYALQLSSLGLTAFVEHKHPQCTCQRKAEARRPSLVRVIVRMLVKDFIICFLQKAVSDLFFLLSPVILGALIKYLAERPEGLEWQGYVLCVSMFLTLIIKSMLFAHAMFLAARLGIRMKSTLIAAVYRKALTMNNSTKNSATVGEIVNLMSVDAQRVQDVMIVIFYASTTPVLFVVAVMLLYFTIGPAIFVGVLLLVCCVPLNAYVVSRQRSLQSDNLKYKDARIRLYNEILNGIKVTH
nr:hypothetical protein BaRGS_014910 [Batillaria attramentaria]